MQMIRRLKSIASGRSSILDYAKCMEKGDTVAIKKVPQDKKI